MGFGILEPLGAGTLPVPGTIQLETDADINAGDVNLKRDSTRPDIILQPQPSDSPQDPLNWSRYKKEAFFFSLFLSTAVIGVIGPVITPSPPQILATFPGTNISDFLALLGYLVLTYGISSYLAVCLSERFGRRPACFISHILLLWGIIWAALAQTYGQLLGARIVQGFGMGVVGFVTDVFFVHEQGVRLALWQISFNATICCSPIIAGVINEKLGWRFLFWVLLPFQAVAMIAFLFLQPESIYDRRSRVASETSVSAVHLDSLTTPSEDKKGDLSTDIQTPQLAASLSDLQPSPRSQYRLWGTVSRPVGSRGIWSLLLRPMLLLLSPCVMYATLLYTFTFSWFILLSGTYSVVYAAPPYNLSSASVGYIGGAAPLIGVLIALISSGPILDGSARYLAKRNAGIFEPEFRLVLNLPMFICFIIGAIGWGYSVSRGQNIIVTAVYLAFLNAGAAYGTIGSISYAVSLYPARGGATFGIIMLFKAIYAWSATLYVAEWQAKYGVFVFCVEKAIRMHQRERN